MKLFKKLVVTMLCFSIIFSLNTQYTFGSSNHISVTYQVYDSYRGYFLPNVTDTQDYAGVFGRPISGVYANLSEGNITYKVRLKGSSWLPEVTNRSDYAGIKGREIDGLMIKTDTGRIIKYRVHTVNGGWLPYVSGYNEYDHNYGYAGIRGRSIDAIQIFIEPAEDNNTGGADINLDVPYYSQSSGNIVNITSSTSNGCTLTASSMLYDYKYGYKTSYSSYDTLKYWWGGIGTSTPGMHWSRANLTQIKSGSKNSIDYTEIYNQLNNGKPVLLYVSNGTGAYYAHAVVVKGYVTGTSANNLSANKFIINDPANSSRTNLQDMLNAYNSCTNYRLFVIN